MMLVTSCGSLSRDVGGVVRGSAGQHETSTRVKSRSMASCAGASIGTRAYVHTYAIEL